MKDFTEVKLKYERDFINWTIRREYCKHKRCIREASRWVDGYGS